MITNFKDYKDTQQLQEQEEFDPVMIEDLGYSRRMIVFENYWNDSFFSEFNNQSCKPFLENIGNLIGEQVTVGHRYVNSIGDLQYYLNDPGGVIWDHPESFGVSYFGMHGSKLGFPLPQGLIDKDDILDLCSGFKNLPNNILYFGSCSLFEDDDKFGYDLLESSGSKGILGYKENVPFSLGTIIDLLFLSTFFLYKAGDPFQNLEGIYNGLITDLPLAKTIGFSLYC